jgi:hypothetical protein
VRDFVEDFDIYSNLDLFLDRIKLIFKHQNFYIVKFVRILLEIKQLSDEDLKLIYNEENGVNKELVLEK